MTPSTSHNQRQVVLIVDACSDANPLVDLAVDLAVEMTADGETHLQGLFIEDEDLLSAADLPCSQEIFHHSALQRETSREQVLEILRRQSERFHRYLKQEAEASQLQWSSANRSGQSSFPQVFIESTASCHILARPISRHVRLTESRVHRIVLLEGASPFLLQALQVVIRQIQAHRVEVILIGKLGQTADDPSMLPLVRSWQKDFPLLSVKEYPRGQLMALLTEPPSCDYVLLSSEEPEDIQRAVRTSLGCPIVLVS